MVTGHTRCCSLIQRLIPATTTSSSIAVTVYWRCQDTSPRLCVPPVGLLQLTTVWRVRPERRRATCNYTDLRQLHWLPVRQRVQFKVAVVVFQCLSGNAPTCLSDDCQLIADINMRRLRSTDTATCAVCSGVTRGKGRWGQIYKQ